MDTTDEKIIAELTRVRPSPTPHADTGYDSTTCGEWYAKAAIRPPVARKASESSQGLGGAGTCVAGCRSGPIAVSLG